MTIVEKDLGDILILRPQKKGNYTFTVSLNDKAGNKISETVTVKVKPVIKDFKSKKEQHNNRP
jgi:hypothetical protein